MNKELQEYIKQLSLNDNKTLSQKALKVSEETGELARVTLPFDNASGTIHRFIEKERVLEESVDVILTAISMAYDLGFSHDDIEEMMWRKAKKWNGIQVKEDKIDDLIPYEIHITVNLEDYITKLKIIDSEAHSGYTGDVYYIPKKTHALEEEAINDFKKICGEINVKPIALNLENNGKNVMKDVMTSSHHIGSNGSVIGECARICSHLEDKGFIVSRKKIETVPWHPSAPSNSGDKMPGDCYFEAHIGCVIKPIEKSKLEHIAVENNAHLSRNFFKKMDGDRFVNMMTLRFYDGTYSDFMMHLEDLKKALIFNDIEFEKVITEFAIYDTKVSHDFLWLKKQKK